MKAEISNDDNKTAISAGKYYPPGIRESKKGVITGEEGM